ncbi:MAG TPA: glycosyltransferase family 39 protein [Anaerolineae bacterium]|nr:glycosyltransferase family 39 protein [Anaerolineae bacterium]
MSDHTSSPFRKPILALGFVVLLAWAIRLYRLDAQSFQLEEAYARYIAGLSPAETLYWSSRDVVPPLHSYLLALWLPLAGSGEFSARFLSVWMGTLAVAVVMRMGKELHSSGAGLLAGVLAAVLPYYVWYSQYARIYMPQALFGLLATLCLIRALRRPERRRRWVGVALFDALMLYTQVTGGFLIAFHALVVLVSGLVARRRERWISGMTSLAVAAALWLPWVVYAWPFLGENAGYWPGRLEWSVVAMGTLRGILTGEVMEGAAVTAAFAAWGSAMLVSLAALIDRRRLKTALFLMAHLSVPVVLLAVLFQNIPKFSPRYMILAAPPFVLLPAMGLATLFQRAGRRRTIYRVLGGLMLVALVTSAGLGLNNLFFNSAYAHADFRTAARLVREQMQPDEAVAIVPGFIFPVWGFYFGPGEWIPLPDDPILNLNHVLHYKNTIGPLNRYLAGRSGVWLVEWEAYVIDPTELVGTLLDQLGTELPVVQQPAGIRLRHYRLRSERLPLPSKPMVSPPVSSALTQALDLQGCVLPENVPGDRLLTLACYWQARQVLPNLSISFRLLDTAGSEWGRADSAISGAYLPPEHWPLDEPVLGRYTLRPLPGIPPGDFYQLQLILYGMDKISYGKVSLGLVTISRPAAPFTETLASQAAPLRLGGLMLEGARISPEAAPPDSTVQVEAIWRVVEPFQEPQLRLADASEAFALLPKLDATSAWQVGDQYRTISRLPISPHAQGGLTTIWAASGDMAIPIGTVNVEVTRAFSLPAGIPALDYRLGDLIGLAGAKLDIERPAAGESVTATLYWQAHTFIERPYTVFVHLFGPDGRLYRQADAWPQAGRHPTTHWLPGEVIGDRYRLELPADAPSGAYQVFAGMYDLDTLVRLPATDAQGEPVPDNAIPIGSFEIP